MFEYIARLFILIPVVGGLAWASLWLWRRVQPGFPAAGPQMRAVRIVDAISLGTSGKLAVVEFGGKDILLAVSRSQISLIAENHRITADD